MCRAHPKPGPGNYAPYLGGVRPTAAPVEFHTPGGPMVAKGSVVSSMVSSTAFFMFDQMYM